MGGKQEKMKKKERGISENGSGTVVVVAYSGFSVWVVLFVGQSRQSVSVGQSVRQSSLSVGFVWSVSPGLFLVGCSVGQSVGPFRLVNVGQSVWACFEWI